MMWTTVCSPLKFAKTWDHLLCARYLTENIYSVSLSMPVLPHPFLFSCIPLFSFYVDLNLASISLNLTMTLKPKASGTDWISFIPPPKNSYWNLMPNVVVKTLGGIHIMRVEPSWMGVVPLQKRLPSPLYHMRLQWKDSCLSGSRPSAGSNLLETWSWTSWPSEK